MNKVGHITVSRKLLSDKVAKRHRFSFLLGSILPDILVHTYIRGHKWEKTFEKNCKRLAHLENWGGQSCFSYLRLGYVIHYVEDYFTFPHNSIYEDSMKEHIKYEAGMEQFLKKLDFSIVEKDNIVMSAAMLRVWLVKNHKEYLELPEHNFETDFKHISKAAQLVVNSMEVAFERNENKGVDLGMDIGLELGIELELDELDVDSNLDLNYGMSIHERV